MKRFTLILLIAVLSTSLALAQSVNVTGTVKGDDGNPLPGVAVTVKGTHIGSITDVKGKYTISAPANGVLSFSFVGMNTKEVVIGSRNLIDVTLTASVDAIDEVVVVAYGTQKRSSITGSIGTMKAAQLEDRQAANITKVLEGNIAGIQSVVSSGQPGTAATIRIRGVGSISASNNPLYVVDGIPYDGGMESINPADIESLSVLKDASANAIYGARGANGVILITTKRGTSSEALVSVDIKVGTNSRGTPQYNVINDPGLYYETYYTQLYNSQLYNGISSLDSHAYARNTLTSRTGLGYNIYTIPEGETLVGTNFKLNPNAKLGYSDGTNYFTPDNWYDESFKKNNLRQDYNVSISGATEKMNYLMSFGYLNDTGIIDNSGFSRYSARIKADYQAKKWLKVGANVGFTSYDSKFPDEGDEGWASSSNLFYAANMIAPIYPMYVRNANGAIKRDDKGLIVYDSGTNTGSSRPFMGTAVPNASIKYNKQSSISDVLTTKWYAQIDIVKGLKFTTNIGLNLNNSKGNNLYNPYYGGAQSVGGMVSVDAKRDRGLTQQYLFAYNNVFCEKHSLDILAGFESYDLKRSVVEVSNTDIYNPSIPEIGNTTNAIPKGDSYTNRYSTRGFIGRVQYDYDSKYMVSASYRRDASSVFHPNNRWGNFGSVGLAWMINKEDFFKADWVDILKLKVSYGVQGNDDLGRNTDTWAWYAYQDQYKLTSSGGQQAIALSFKGNPDITWESSHSFNTGVDFSLFNGRFGGSVEFFNRVTSNLLYMQPVPGVLGYSTIPMNIGKIRNRGWELDLNGILYRNNDINISMFLNATTYKNVVLDMADGVKKNGIKTSMSIIKVGGSVYDTYMVRGAGIDPETGKQLYYVDPDNGNWSKTSVYTDAKQSVLGTTLPTVYGGFGLNAKLYGFDVSCTFAYQLGGHMYDFSYMQMMQPGTDRGQNFHVDMLNSWSQQNKKSTIARLNFADAGSQNLYDRYMTRSDFFSLNNLTVGYTLPNSLTSKFKISKLRIYAVGDNLAFASARRGLDPRMNTAGLNGNTYTYAGNFQYSAMRTISGGISFTF